MGESARRKARLVIGNTDISGPLLARWESLGPEKRCIGGWWAHLTWEPLALENDASFHLDWARRSFILAKRMNGQA
jgi:hypothetical protein